jgi:tRNA A-37 threonylcarbamoyl transferase component Bud32
MGLSLGTLFPLRWRLWLGKLLFPKLGPSTVRVSWHRVIKGPCLPSEIEAMEYVAAHTDVPVPKLYAVHTDAKKNYIYIEMAYIPGQNLEHAWSDLTMDGKHDIIADLQQHISRLRGLPPPASGFVSSALQNPAYDGRVGNRFFGPFSLRDFHSLLRKHMPQDYIEEAVGKQVAAVHSPDASYRLCFTHADLAPRNIMVRNGRIVAIVDWGYAGWYPEYWEFTKAHWNSFWSEEWDDMIDAHFPRYDLEMEAERVLWHRLDDPGTPTTAYLADGSVFKSEGSKPSAAWMDARAGRPLKDLWSIALLEFQ